MKTKHCIAKYVLGTTLICFACEIITAVMVIIMISVDVVQDQGNRDWARGLTLCLYSAALTLLAAISQAIALRFFDANDVLEFSPPPEKKIIPVFQHPLGVPLRESPKLQKSNIRMTTLPYASPYEPRTSTVPRVTSPVSVSSFSSSVSSRSTLPKALRNVTDRRRPSTHQNAMKDFTGFINKSYNG
ncbi:Oidioi.mRNA.OKI2018_I69.PAR.g8815.t1.cds [Oikopleura dioica]|uniref:Oidioi.mRNA.OKI2018_I69.PAR.g8815.t1.cds n=1 Tax=Oikopleura dioica TaxID=34765 RepID=A0ABN7RL51_OIKDI|nr:Oidioi.mRNA.OKI2018_I69.PAR.g8815.t1.cds [Oikopleura dioica]